MGAFQEFLDESPEIRTDIVLVKASTKKKPKEVELLRRVHAYTNGTAEVTTRTGKTSPSPTENTPVS